MAVNRLSSRRLIDDNRRIFRLIEHAPIADVSTGHLANVQLTDTIGKHIVKNVSVIKTRVTRIAVLGSR